MSSEVEEPFSAPFNWCDRKCERCPISRDCALWKREQQRRWGHEARGRDPDDLEVAMEDVSKDLEQALRMLQEAAVEDGIDLDAPMPARTVALEAERLRRASMSVVRRLGELHVGPDAQEKDAGEVLSACSLMAAKIARIAGYIDDGRRQPVWTCDAAPNLLLIEHLRRRFGAALEIVTAGTHPDEGLVDAVAELDRLLAPVIAEVAPAARAELAGLEARGVAPSPFCVA